MSRDVERTLSKDPDNRTTPSAHVEELTAHGVEGNALTFVDNTGITRVKAVPTSRLEAVATTGVGMSPVFDVFVLDDSITASRTSTGPVGDLRLYRDLARLVELAAQPGWAWAPVNRCARSGEFHPLCQRSFATRMMERAAEQGLSALMSFEVEWVIDTGNGPRTQLDLGESLLTWGFDSNRVANDRSSQRLSIGGRSTRWLFRTFAVEVAVHLRKTPIGLFVASSSVAD